MERGEAVIGNDGMRGPDGSSDLPICFSIELVSFDEDGTSGLRSGDDDYISRYSLLRVDLDYITHLNIL
jgi:hypothetical protein